MADRPREYGDQFPSDQDDVAPGDPTSGFQEQDYAIQQSTGKRRKVQNPRNFVPNLNVDNPEPVERDSWHGVILKVLTKKNEFPQRYDVLKQDGEKVEAFCTHVLNYEEFKPGHDVILNRGAVEGQYSLIGKSRSKEAQAVSYYNSISEERASPFIVPFETYNIRTPISDHFSDKPAPGEDACKIESLGDGTFIVHEEEEAVYDISFNVSLTLTNPIASDSPTAISPIFLETGCWWLDKLDNFTFFSKEAKTKKIFFHEQNGFRLYYDQKDCSGNIAIKCGKPDMILNQQYPKDVNGTENANYPAEWTDEPLIGNSVQVGTRVSQGWVKIGNKSQYVWLSHGGGGSRLKLQFPNGPPCGESASEGAFGGFLRAVAVSGECVKLGWKKPGETQMMSVLTSEIESWNHCYIYCCDAEGYPNTEGPYQTCLIPEYKSKPLNFECGFFVGGRTPDPQECPNKIPMTTACWKAPDFFDPCDFHFGHNGNAVTCEVPKGC